MLDQIPQRQPGRPLDIAHVLNILSTCAEPVARVEAIAAIAACNGAALHQWLQSNKMTIGQVQRARRGDPIADEGAAWVEHYLDTVVGLGVACSACEGESGRDGFAIAQAELTRKWDAVSADKVIVALRRAVDAAAVTTRWTNTRQHYGGDIQARIDDILNPPEADQPDESKTTGPSPGSPAETELTRRIDRLLRGEDDGE